VNPVSFLLQHPYSVLFGVVLAEQLGLPLPAAPLLLGAGALVGAGKLDLTTALALAIAACLIADFSWYEAGRRRGAAVLGFLCRLSLEPESCVRRTEDVFARHGERTLLIAKFLPGLSALATPLAGVTGVSRRRFLRLAAGEDLVIIDLRSEREYLADPTGIPGSRRFRLKELGERHRERSRATATWCSTARAPTRRRAPTWHSCCGAAASCG
jgi:hypothetical protein